MLHLISNLFHWHPLCPTDIPEISSIIRISCLFIYLFILRPWTLSLTRQGEADHGPGVQPIRSCTPLEDHGQPPLTCTWCLSLHVYLETYPGCGGLQVKRSATKTEGPMERRRRHTWMNTEQQCSIVCAIKRSYWVYSEPGMLTFGRSQEVMFSGLCPFLE